MAKAETGKECSTHRVGNNYTQWSSSTTELGFITKSLAVVELRNAANLIIAVQLGNEKSFLVLCVLPGLRR